MELICCTKIQGNPRHRIETCFVRKEKKAKILSKKERSLGWKHGTTGVTGDYFFNICDSCDPTEMETVKVDTSQFTAPKMTKIRKKEVVMGKKEESRPTHKPKYNCKCGFSTDDPGKFIIEQGICRKCYMSEYYKKNPREKKDLGKPKKVTEEKEVILPLRRGKDGLLVGMDPSKGWTGGGECTTQKMNDAIAAVESGGVAVADSPVGKAKFLSAVRDRERETSRDKVLLDFTDHPELLEILEARANLEFRTLNMQILFFLHSGVIQNVK